MKKYQILFTILVLALILMSSYFDLKKSKKVREVHLQDFNQTIKDLKLFLDIPPSKIYPNSHNLWDMQLSNVLKKRIAKLEEEKQKRKIKKIKPKKQNLKVKGRKICLENRCWELMGVVTINDTRNLILLTKKPKPKSKFFKVGDEILPKIFIITIGEESVVLLNKLKNKKITLKLFDINLSKYQPKVIKDKHE